MLLINTNNLPKCSIWLYNFSMFVSKFVLSKHTFLCQVVIILKFSLVYCFCRSSKHRPQSNKKLGWIILLLLNFQQNGQAEMMFLWVLVQILKKNVSITIVCVLIYIIVYMQVGDLTHISKCWLNLVMVLSPLPWIMRFIMCNLLSFKLYLCIFHLNMMLIHESTAGIQAPC